MLSINNIKRLKELVNKYNGWCKGYGYKYKNNLLNKMQKIINDG